MNGSKRFSITASVGLQSRGELLNLFNTPNFDRRWSSRYAEQSSQCSSVGGRSIQTLNRSTGGSNALCQIGGPGSVQLELRLEF